MGLHRNSLHSNSRLTSFEIGQAIGRSRQAVDSYIADSRASTELEMDLEIFRMHRLGLPQKRIANRLSAPQRTLSDHLAKMPSLAIPLNGDPGRQKSLAKAPQYDLPDLPRLNSPVEFNRASGAGMLFSYLRDCETF